MAEVAKDPAFPPDANQSRAVSPASRDLLWAITKLRAAAGVVIDADLVAAYQAASSPHSIRALASDLAAFDFWCRAADRIAVPATPGTVADYLDARAGEGARPASLGRYKASIAKIHQLLGLVDPTPAPIVKLRLAAIRRRLGSAQKQAWPLRFKGPVRDVARDQPRGLNIRALLESCSENLPELRDRALLSIAYDTGLRASELVAVEVKHIVAANDPEARLLTISRGRKATRTRRGPPPSSARAAFARSRPGWTRPGSGRARSSGG